MEKTVDYYMGLHYTVELKPARGGYRASIKELPACTATVYASDNVEKLWQLLEKNQREWIEQELAMGREVPEPPGATKDPFWEDFEAAIPNFDEEDVRSELYEYGATRFPLRILEELWLQELEKVRLGEVRPSSGIPPKAEINHHDQRTPWLKGDVRPVRLGKGGKGAWIRLDGPRAKHGYRNIEVLDKTLRTEAAIVAALTALEASTIEKDGFERLRKALLKHVEAHPELKGKGLQEILNKLPSRWFYDQKIILDKELVKELDEKLLPLSSEETDKGRRDHLKRVQRWERTPKLWGRTIRYLVALLRYRRPNFDDYTLDQQLKLVNKHRKHINQFLEKQREHMAFLEYGTPERTPTPVRRARDQVRAAVLKDVEGLSHLKIAKRLGIDITEDYVEDRYKQHAKIPEVDRLITKGQALLGRLLSREGGWQTRAEQMKAEAERYRSLDEESRLIARVAENTGWTVEHARSFCTTSPGLAEFMATDFSDPRPRL